MIHVSHHRGGDGPGGLLPAGDPVIDGATVRQTMSILIVEDEAMIAWTLESLFEDMGFRDIAIAATGEEATERALRHAPGLIVSDINLGAGVDGVEAAVRMRTVRDIPVIFISGYAGSDVRARVDAEIPGALVLRKPIQPDELGDAVTRILREASHH